VAVNKRVRNKQMIEAYKAAVPRPAAKPSPVIGTKSGFGPLPAPQQY
jgi:hypothetical protein